MHPFQNNFKELFNILRLVRPNILDLNSFQSFFSRLISIITATERQPKLMYRGNVQDTLERIFSEVLGYALQSSTEEVKTFTIEYTTLTRNPYIPISYVTFLQVKIYIEHIHLNIIRATFNLGRDSICNSTWNLAESYCPCIRGILGSKMGLLRKIIK